MTEHVVVNGYEYVFSPNTNAPNHGAWWFCNLCSALVYNPDAHARWHESSRVDDIRSDILWYREELAGKNWRGVNVTGVPNPERNKPSCRVYWGSHGCARPQDHDGAHWCDCCDCADHPDDDSGCVAGPPYYGPDTHFFGEDSGQHTEEDSG